MMSWEDILEIVQQIVDLPLYARIAVGVWLVLSVTLVLSALLLRPRKEPLVPGNSSGATAAASVETESHQRKALRLAHHVRRLRDIEVGLTVERLPRGVYAFIDPAQLTDSAEAFSESDQRHCLEVHRLADRSLWPICAVSQDTATRFETEGKGEFTAFAASWAEASTLVAVPRSQLTKWAARSFARGILIEFSLSEVSNELRLGG